VVSTLQGMSQTRAAPAAAATEDAVVVAMPCGKCCFIRLVGFCGLLLLFVWWDVVEDSVSGQRFQSNTLRISRIRKIKPMLLCSNCPSSWRCAWYLVCF
jgi:hypothetical protein